jgi:uncharacterized protein DUF4231
MSSNNPPESALDALDDRIKRFTEQADKYKFRFRFFQIVVIVASGILPIINLADFASFPTRLISSVLGGLIVILTAITQMDKNHEMWILKASVEHALKGEKLLFTYNAYPYTDVDKKEALLVNRMHSIISSHLENYFKEAGQQK